MSLVTDRPGGGCGWSADNARRTESQRAADRSRDPSNYFQAGVSRGNDEIEVFVDGVRIPSCVRANVAQGWATHYDFGADGVVIRDGLDRPKEFYVHGKVELRKCN